MGRLKNIKKAPFEIATLLAGNEKIRKLIYIDSSEALASASPEVDVEQLIKEEYINFSSVTSSGVKDMKVNSFISILFEDFSFFSDSTNVSGAIYISTDAAHQTLNGNKNRLMELIDEIEDTLNDVKLSSAGKIRVSDASYVVFSEFRAGYRISIQFVDQDNRKAEL
jgi:hypothetical protein